MGTLAKKLLIFNLSSLMNKSSSTTERFELSSMTFVSWQGFFIIIIILKRKHPRNEEKKETIISSVSYF
jgi:hypothetical protein